MTPQIVRHILPHVGPHMEAGAGSVLLLLLLPVFISLLAGTAHAAEQRKVALPPNLELRKDAPPQARPAAWLSGAVTYRERMALPPDAVLVIRLCKRQGEALLAELRLPVDGKNVPLPFHLAVPAGSRVGDCDVRAEIVDGNGPLFASDALTLPEKAGRELTILTSRVMPEAEAPAQAPGDETLSGVRWRLLELDGQPARVFDQQPEPHLIFLPESGEDPSKGRIGGSDGCNRLLGRYEREGNAIRFLDLGSTMMLCPNGAEQARAYARALHEADAWLLTERRLELYQGSRRLAVFAAVAL